MPARVILPSTEVTMTSIPLNMTHGSLSRKKTTSFPEDIFRRIALASSAWEDTAMTMRKANREKSLFINK